ncbi:MAG: N-terminal phage integrase SAM-like domain-containing protein [Acidobacteriota bacterium]
MTDKPNNQDWREGLKREIAARVAAGQPFDDILAMLCTPAPVEAPVPSKPQPTGKTRRAGQIVERGENKHLIRISVGADQNGKRLYHNKTFRGTKKDAEKWLRGALRRLDMGEPIEESDQGFGAFFEEWLKGKAGGIKASSHQKYRVIGDCHLLPALKDRKLSLITPALLESFFNGLSEKGLSGRTITHIRAVLTGCLSKAVKLEMMRRNPLDSVDTPRAKRLELHPITQEEGRALLDQARGSRFESLAVFLLSTDVVPANAWR